MSQEALRELDKVFEESRKEVQTKLPPEDRMSEGEFCNLVHDGWTCTKAKDHGGKEHVAHGMLGTVVQRWRS